MKNEATLTSRIDQVLRTVFPTFREVNTIHQKSFSIKFGHHEVTVDLKDPSDRASKAISDVLLTVEGKNMILLELKKENLNLTEEDSRQGLSYARLISPMPPLVLISNGKDNFFYQTYTGEKLEIEDNINLAYLQKLVDNSFMLATNDFKEALDCILNSNAEIFSQVINQISQRRFNRISGSITEFSKAITHDFQIRRSLISKIQQKVSEGAGLIGIIGSAFSGKTNLLYQFYEATKSESSFLLYIDCFDHNYGILQQLANHFSKNTTMSVTPEKIREWLNLSLANMPGCKFYLLLDNFNGDLPEAIKTEVIELIDIFEGTPYHHTIYTIDEYNYNRLAYIPQRKYTSIIGSLSKVLTLEELNDEEFELAQQKLFDNSIVIEHGGHYALEYREPRILRYVAGMLQKNVTPDNIVQIVAVPDLGLLRAIITNETITPSIHDLYKKIIFCFFAEEIERKKDSHLAAIASGTGAIKVDTFRHLYPNDYQILLESSTIVLREVYEGYMVIYPKMPELIAWHAISHVSALTAQRCSQKATKADKCKVFTDILTILPYCDIVGAAALKSLANTDDKLFTDLIFGLIDIEPQFEKIYKGTEFLMYIDKHIHLKFGDDMDDGGFISDFMPYAVLSQLVGEPMALSTGNGDEEDIYRFHLSLLYRIGSSKHFLRRADVRSISNMKSYESYEFIGHGTIISGREGIIEPIVQSIQKCFFAIPDEIKRLYKAAIADENIVLLYRIYLAIRKFDRDPNSPYTAIVKEFLVDFDDYFHQFMAKYLVEDVEDTYEREKLRKRLLSLKGGPDGNS